ncbi:MAG TPA: alginate lyase family protein [Candidatus Prevotella stercoripullorum]|nr:alginate lyase family protein [Candidatus Prevotella stercoripullorum]
MKLSKIMLTAGLAALIALQTSCRENEYGTVDLTMPDDETPSYEPIEAQYQYPHPCIMYSQDDFDYVKQSFADGTAPQEVQDELQALKNSQFASLSYIAQPQSCIVRGDDKGTPIDDGTDKKVENYAYAMRDAGSAYQQALLYKLTDDEQYAAAAVKTLNAWAATCKGIYSNDANMYLAAGAQGYTFAAAAEMLRGSESWNDADFNTFCNWLVDVFATRNAEFLAHTDPNTCALHTWSNWDLVNLCSYLAIGILTEDDEMVNYVVNYFYNGAGNGCIKNLIQGRHTDPLTGEPIYQNQESGRDQGHAEMSAMVTANLAQMAYTLYVQNPEVTQLDFFSADDNALLKMGEYVALSNLRNGTDNANKDGQWVIAATEMPFTTYEYCVGCSCKDKNHSATQTQLANDEGRGSVRPGWEIYYNHYKRVKGLSSGFTYVKQFADKLRPECGVGEGQNRYGTNSGAFDQLGWGTLMLYRGE